MCSFNRMTTVIKNTGYIKNDYPVIIICKWSVDPQGEVLFCFCGTIQIKES